MARRQLVTSCFIFVRWIFSDVVEVFTLFHSHRLPFLSPTRTLCNRFVSRYKHALFRKVRVVRGVCVCVCTDDIRVKMTVVTFYTNVMKAFCDYSMFFRRHLRRQPPPFSVTTVHHPSLLNLPQSAFPLEKYSHTTVQVTLQKSTLSWFVFRLLLSLWLILPGMFWTGSQDNQLCCLVECLAWNIDTLMHW